MPPAADARAGSGYASGAPRSAARLRQTAGGATVGNPPRWIGRDAIRRSRVGRKRPSRDRPLASCARSRKLACPHRTLPQAAFPSPRLSGKSGLALISLGISGGYPMKTLSLAASAVAILTWLTSTSVVAQQRGAEPPLQLHAVNPSLSLSAPTTTPIQQQMRQDYATGLMGAQRDLLQQNPSGLGRQEEAIGHELNGFTAPR